MDPAMPPSPGPGHEAESQYRLRVLVAVTVVCMLVVSAVTTLRIYTRHFLLRRLGIDDMLAVASWLIVMGVGALYLAHINYGLGSPFGDFTNLAAITLSIKFYFAEGLLYNFAHMVIKLFICAQYYRIVSQTRHRIPCLAVGALVAAWSLGIAIMAFFSCVPFEANWDLTLIPQADCAVLAKIWIASVGNIVTDLLLLLLPVPVVCKLEMETSQKVLTIAIFGIGAFPCIVSILRMTSIRLTDPGFGTTLGTWTVGELAAGCICPSLMVLRPLLRSMASGLTSFRRNGRYSSQNRHYGLGEPRPQDCESRSSSVNPPPSEGSQVELYSRDIATPPGRRDSADRAV